VHGRRCALSPGDPKNCKCECGGELHGSAWGSAPSGAQSAPSRRGNVRRAAGLTITVVAAVTIGPLAISAVLGGSSTGRKGLSVQVKADLNKALSDLAVLGFRNTRSPNSSTSGPNYRTDCAKSATGRVRQFLSRHPCKQYATATRTVAKRGATALVAFSWVEMPTATLAGRYKVKVDAYNTGNPPGVSLAFNGLCYTSGQHGATVWTVEVRPTGHVNVDREILQAAAQAKLSPNYLRQHCIR
jgi:hypothetical protein